MIEAMTAVKLFSLVRVYDLMIYESMSIAVAFMNGICFNMNERNQIVKERSIWKGKKLYIVLVYRYRAQAYSVASFTYLR